MDPSQKKLALEHPVAESQEEDIKARKPTFNYLQINAGLVGEDGATTVPDRSCITDRSPGESVVFSTCKPLIAACFVQLQGMPRVGGLEAGRNT